MELRSVVLEFENEEQTARLLEQLLLADSLEQSVTHRLASSILNPQEINEAVFGVPFPAWGDRPKHSWSLRLAQALAQKLWRPS